MKTKPARSFTKNSLAQIAFPLGGIGTGTISLGGRGNLQDWEIFNRPNKGSHLPMTFFAMRAQPLRGGDEGRAKRGKGKSPSTHQPINPSPAVTRILERQYLPPFTGAHGFPRHALSGVSRFQEVTFRGEYPFAWLDFHDDEMPVQVSLEAFNPFIPMNVEDSSIPCAILRYTVKNTKRTPVSVSLLAVMRNPIGFQTLPSERKIEETLNAYREEEVRSKPRSEAEWRAGQATAQDGTPQTPCLTTNGFHGIYFTAPGLPDDDINFGTASLTTDHAETDVQTHLYRGGWWDSAHILWDEFTATGRLTPCLDDIHGVVKPPTLTIAEQIAGAQGVVVSQGTATTTATKKYRDESGALCLRAELAPSESRTFTVFIHWHFPNARLWGKDGAKVRTFVGNQFSDAWDAARYTHNNFARLESETRKWHETFFSSTLPAEVLDAVSSQMSIIRTQTVLRLSDGKIYAWEGCGDEWGCCAGNCSHVWNYTQALAFLFPSLERTMRQIEFGPSMKPNGAMAFRCAAPSGKQPVGWNFHPCGDGQMGAIIRAYRDWQLSGDDSFLRELWPNIKKALEFAWTEPNGWDPNKDGVMEGCQHNTYDIEFYGPNTLMGAMYLGALRAAEEMARYLGEEDKAREYRQIYESGRAKTEKLLWNGEYFIQQVEVMKGLEVPPHLQSPMTCETDCDCKPARENVGAQSTAPDCCGEGAGASDCAPTSEVKESEEPAIYGAQPATRPKYQYGEGCLSDQLLGQQLAHVAGLGYVLDEEKVRKTVAAIFQYNFRAPLGGFDNVQRTYALQDEAGLLLCSWPHGNRPALPFPYSDEVWTGFEYQVASHLIYEGFVQEGVAIVKAIRARHDGVRRNPWNEFECGWHYARALSSWALIQAFSGVHYSAVEQSLTFDPKLGGSRSAVTVPQSGRRDRARPSKSITPFTCVFAAGSAWGLLRVEKNKATLEIRHGKLTLKTFGTRQNPQTFSAAKELAAGQSASISLRS